MRGGGRDLALGGSLVMGDQDVRVQAGRNLRAGTVADSGSGNGSNGTGGNNNGNTAPVATPEAPAVCRHRRRHEQRLGRRRKHRDRRQHAIGRPGIRQGATLRRDITWPDLGARTLQAEAGGELSTTAGARLQSGQAMGIRAGEGVTLAGSA